jgi:hypothetical protein
MVSCHRTNPVIDPAVRFMAAFPPGLLRARMVNLRATQAHSDFVRISKYSAIPQQTGPEIGSSSVKKTGQR